MSIKAVSFVEPLHGGIPGKPRQKGVVEKYEEILQDITPLEIFSLNDYSTETLLSLDQIKSEAGKFVNLFNHGLKKFSWNRACSPLMEHFLKENEAIDNIGEP